MTKLNRLSGTELDKYIESELLAMEREGLEKSPIKASTLHVRLIAKGYINGGLSILSTNIRKDMIAKYKLRQHHSSELKQDEIDLLEGRRTNAAYIKKAKRMELERDEYKEKYHQNLFAVLDIIKYVQVMTPVKIEDILSPYLVRELKSKK